VKIPLFEIFTYFMKFLENYRKAQDLKVSVKRRVRFCFIQTATNISGRISDKNRESS